MTRFNKVNYNARTTLAEVGAGLIWDNVYAALEPYKRTVVGGRTTGVGVAGLILGGGMFCTTHSTPCKRYSNTTRVIQDIHG